MRQGVIFDMDGVLVDNRDIHIEAFVVLCKKYGVTLSKEKLFGVFGMGNDEILPIILPDKLIKEKGLRPLAEEKEAIYREIFEKTIAPTPGLVPFLHALPKEGFRTAVGSSGMEANVRFVLEKCGIADCFDAVVNGDMVTRCKPDPEIFLTASRLMQVPPTECVVIEDSFAGIQAARNAGMGVIAMATTFSKDKLKATDNDMIVSDFTPLTPRIIRSL